MKGRHRSLVVIAMTVGRCALQFCVRICVCHSRETFWTKIITIHQCYKMPYVRIMQSIHHLIVWRYIISRVAREIPDTHKLTSGASSFSFFLGVFFFFLEVFSFRFDSHNNCSEEQNQSGPLHDMYNHVIHNNWVFVVILLLRLLIWSNYYLSKEQSFSLFVHTRISTKMSNVLSSVEDYWHWSRLINMLSGLAY